MNKVLEKYDRVYRKKYILIGTSRVSRCQSINGKNSFLASKE